jgi:hypothetical protein
MITTPQINKKHWTTLIFVVVSAMWLNFIVIPCVHAVNVDQQIRHDCPHCPVPEKDPCHSDSGCSDCDNGLNTLKAEKNNQKLDDSTKYTALPASCDSDYLDVTRHSNVLVTSIETHYPSPPIYLKNCAFLN